MRFAQDSVCTFECVFLEYIQTHSVDEIATYVGIECAERKDPRAIIRFLIDQSYKRKDFSYNVSSPELAIFERLLRNELWDDKSSILKGIQQFQIQTSLASTSVEVERLWMLYYQKYQRHQKLLRLWLICAYGHEQSAVASNILANILGNEKSKKFQVRIYSMLIKHDKLRDELLPRYVELLSLHAAEAYSVRHHWHPSLVELIVRLWHPFSLQLLLEYLPEDRRMSIKVARQIGKYSKNTEPRVVLQTLKRLRGRAWQGLSLLFESKEVINAIFTPQFHALMRATPSRLHTFLTKYSYDGSQEQRNHLAECKLLASASRQKKSINEIVHLINTARHSRRFISLIYQGIKNAVSSSNDGSVYDIERSLKYLMATKRFANSRFYPHESVGIQLQTYVEKIKGYVLNTDYLLINASHLFTSLLDISEFIYAVCDITFMSKLLRETMKSVGTKPRSPHLRALCFWDRRLRQILASNSKPTSFYDFEDSAKCFIHLIRLCARNLEISYCQEIFIKQRDEMDKRNRSFICFLSNKIRHGDISFQSVWDLPTIKLSALKTTVDIATNVYLSSSCQPQLPWIEMIRPYETVTRSYFVINTFDVDIENIFLQSFPSKDGT